MVSSAALGYARHARALATSNDLTIDVVTTAGSEIT
jgi:hypothetical protein